MRRVADVLGKGLPATIWSSTEHWPDAGLPRPPLTLAREETAFALVDRRFEEPTDHWSRNRDDEGRCLDTYRVRLVRSYLSFDRRRMLCVYAAPDLEAVRASHRFTRLPWTEVMPVLVRDPG
jgi:hypothetical protein